jgi:hypothetical protein
MYLVGASQWSTQTTTGIVHTHNGTNGWTTARLDLMTPISGKTWVTSVSMNTGSSTYRAARGVMFEATEGFQFVPYGGRNQSVTTASSQVTVTPLENKNHNPGGVCVAMCNHESGYGAGPGSITSASEDAGWVFGGQSGTLAVAYYILSASTPETAPSCTFVNPSYSPDNWSLLSGYVR